MAVLELKNDFSNAEHSNDCSINGGTLSEIVTTSATQMGILGIQLVLALFSWGCNGILKYSLRNDYQRIKSIPLFLCQPLKEE